MEAEERDRGEFRREDRRWRISRGDEYSDLRRGDPAIVIGGETDIGLGGTCTWRSGCLEVKFAGGEFEEALGGSGMLIGGEEVSAWLGEGWVPFVYVTGGILVWVGSMCTWNVLVGWGLSAVYKALGGVVL